MLRSPAFTDWAEGTVNTPYGPVTFREKDGWVFLQRHGHPPLPPHRINHRANVWAIHSLGAESVISLNSTGSLKTELGPGTFVLPDDFFSPWSIPTFFDETMRFTVPSMDDNLRERLYDLCRGLSVNAVNGGIYVQTTGPRLETPAEVRALQAMGGDVVGMTMASEATLCIEQGIPYAGLCSVDNFCNGIAPIPLAVDEIESNSRRAGETFERIVAELLSRGLS